MEAEAKVLADAEEELGRVLSQNLRGKGWVSLKSVGGWFNQPPHVKEALDIVKTKHLRLKDFVASSPLVEMKQENSDFMIALAEDMKRQRAAKEEAERKQREKEENEREARAAAVIKEAEEKRKHAERAAAEASAVEAERITKEAQEQMEREKRRAGEKLLREKEEAEKQRRKIEQV